MKSISFYRDKLPENTDIQGLGIKGGEIRELKRFFVENREYFSNLKEATHIRKKNELPRSVVYIPKENSLYALLKTKGGARVVGKGSFKRATKALNLHTGEVKVFASCQLVELKDKELEHLEKYKNSEHIVLGEPVKYHSSKKRGSKEKIGLMMENMVNGELSQKLKDKLYLFKKDEKIKITINYLLGLAEMHKNGDIHMDVKGENILLGKEITNAKLGDLDFACKVNEETHARGTPYTMSPEVLKQMILEKECIEKNKPRSTARFTTAADMWSVGIILVETFADRERAKKLSAKMGDAIKANDDSIFYDALNSLKISSSVPSSVEDAIKGCLQLKPEKRATAEEVIEYMKEALANKPQESGF